MAGWRHCRDFSGAQSLYGVEYVEYPSTPSKSPCCATRYFDNRLLTYDKTLAGESVDDRQSWNFCNQSFP